MYMLLAARQQPSFACEFRVLLPSLQEKIDLAKSPSTHGWGIKAEETSHICSLVGVKTDEYRFGTI